MINGCFGGLVATLFICMKPIRNGDSISSRYHIMIVSMLKNWSRRYFSHYIIKFSIKMTLNLLIYYKFESINLLFL